MASEHLLPSFQDIRFLQKKMGTHNMTEKSSLCSNVWYDQFNIKYELKNYGALIITIDNFCVPPTIINYINNIPESIRFVHVDYRLKKENIDYFKAFVDISQYINFSGYVFLWMGKNIEFSQYDHFDFSNLPNNVKITNMMNGSIREREFMGENSFDWWCLNLDDNKFAELSLHLTAAARTRASKMRVIAKLFYDSFSKGYLASLTNVSRANAAYEWIKKNTVYDMSALNSDGSLKKGAQYAQDPIITFETRKGVCAGRARLMKVLLNNCYMQVPCFLTNGNYGDIYHEWNEVHNKRDEVYYYDLSGNLKGERYVPMSRECHHKLVHKDYYLNMMDTKEKCI